MTLTGFLPIVLFVGFIIFMFKFGIEQSKKKLAELRRVAPLIGFTVNNNRYGLNQCNEVPPDLLIDHFKVTPLGKEFDLKKVKICDVLEKKEGELTSYLFFYIHSAGGSSKISTRHQVACFIDPEFNLPYFRLQRKTSAQRLENIFGVKNVEVTKNPVFSKNYFLRAEDEGAVRKIFNSEVISFFEKNFGIRVEGSKNSLLFYRSQVMVKPQDLPSFYKEAKGVYDLFSKVAQAS